MGYDCVMIPGASKVTGGVFTPAPNSICGNGAGLVKVAAGVSTTLCSKYFLLLLPWTTLGQDHRRCKG